MMRPVQLVGSFGVGALLLPGLVACGSSANDEIPESLLAAIAAGQGSQQDYPAGPYGSDLGDVARDVCVPAWSDPAAADYAEAELTETCFSDFYDPSGEEYRLLLINTSAIWCTACRSEYGGTGSRPSLAEELAERRELGLGFLGVLFQGAERDPATIDDAALWAQTFDVDFTFGYDPPFAMGAFADPVLQPFNMVIDTRTMQIVLQVEGDEPDTLWPAIDSLLAEDE